MSAPSYRPHFLEEFSHCIQVALLDPPGLSNSRLRWSSFGIVIELHVEQFGQTRKLHSTAPAYGGEMEPPMRLQKSRELNSIGHVFWFSGRYVEH